MVYNHLKHLIPIRKELHFRIESQVGIVNSENNMSLIFLNDTALFIFGLIDSIISIEGIVERILIEYDIDEVTAQNDVVEIIRNLQWHRVISLRSNNAV
jgi:hypothetical protein